MSVQRTTPARRGTMTAAMYSKPKPKESVLDLCTRATLLGNNISVRMLEFLTNVKHQPHGFRDLANDFLDICRILWSIEAGLSEASRTHQEFPADMIKELDLKFRQTNSDFQVLDHMMFEFLEYEKKGAMGKIQRGWRMMFADKEILRMRESLRKARDALRMSALVFQWSLGSSKTDDSVGNGYAGLAAALDRMSNNHSTVRISKSKSFEVQTASPPDRSDDSSPPLPSPLPQISSQAPHIPPPSLVEKISADFVLQEVRLSSDPRRRASLSNKSHHSLSENGHPHSARIPDRRIGGGGGRGDDITISEHGQYDLHQAAVSLRPSINNNTERRLALDDLTISDRDTAYDTPSRLSDRRNHLRDSDNAVSPSSSGTETLIGELQTIADSIPTKVVRLKADPLTMPRWTPRHNASGNPSLKTSLIAAVHGKNHKLVEQLLDRGVSPDTGPDQHVLVDSVLCQDAESVRLLLLFGADANSADKDGITPLFAAVEMNSLEMARTLLKYGADPNLSAGASLESPLAIAVIDVKVDFVHLLLTYGGDPNHIMANGNTVLIASMNKTTPKKLVDLMLDYGSDPNVKNREGKTALFETIMAARVDLLGALLDHGANPNLPGPKHMLWPATYQAPCLKVLLARGADSKKAPGNMELAVSINNIESVRVLLAAGVSPNIKKDGIYTPLCTSIRDNRADILELLLENGADPNLNSAEYPAFKCVTHFRTHFLPRLVAAGNDLHNPKGIIETAVRVNNTEALMWLLDQGVNPNDRGEDGNTPLTTAIRENRAEMLDELLAHGADPSVRGADWPVVMAVQHPAILKKLLPAIPDPRSFKGLMERAVVADQIESVKLLLAAGVSVEDKNGGVFSPLTSAIREDNKEMTRFLIEEGGADVNAPGEHLPIVKAVRRCRGDDTDILEMLLRKGADANKLYRGWNAVMQAVENGDAKLLKLLVAAGGVDLEARDDAGRTVMEIAAGRGWEESVGIILWDGKSKV
ncbi:Putative ankyrin repeat-containing domain superfamily [Colletotrichum destructivum]|uniref:Ankyrin repeat-containing domain superfamily n=2 Tax=Colletotrichum destructivum species complex TaxID=2707350 RepID=A0AAX4IZ22_9PEZI|nr:Putative ankyrin repeat-containing domain superfamily [Colletotrichum destructivum]